MQWWQTIESWTDSGDHWFFLVASAIVAISFSLRHLFSRFILERVTAWTQQSALKIDAVLIPPLASPIGWLFVIGGVEVAIRLLPESHSYYGTLDKIASSLFIALLFWAPYRLIAPLANYITRVRFDMENRGIGQELIDFITTVIKILTVLFGTISLFEHWGFNVAAFLGGLGLAGLAAAMAAKDSLQNIFAGFTIITTRIFRPGDWIETPDVNGTVETIGLRATRVRGFSDCEVTVSNNRLLESPMTNWSRMRRRRVRLQIGIEYGTSSANMKKVTDRLRRYLAESKDVDKKAKCMVHFTSYDDSAIVIDLYYFTKTVDWEKWRGVVHAHIVDFKRIVEESGSAFAFPSQTLYFDSGADAMMPQKIPQNMPRKISGKTPKKTSSKSDGNPALGND